MYFDTLTSEDKITYLIKPILKVLQEAGGQLQRFEIRNRICDMDDNIAEFEQFISISKKTGKEYKQFDFKFNFAIKELSFIGLICYENYKPTITLTTAGANVNLESFDAQIEVRDKAKAFWEQCKEKNNSKTIEESPEDNDDLSSDDNEGISAESQFEDDLQVQLETAIRNMDPKKFEQFSRALLTKMGIEFTDKGIQVSHDGGIDGYGYHRDEDDFRTTRVVIQCKRYNAGPVCVSDINQFLGAMCKHQADYGVFITNSRFTKEARNASKEGMPITLIDGNELIRLIIKYELYLTPVKTYVLDDFYLS